MAPLNVLMVCAEYAPLAKVGGLGDVTAALSAALAARGHQVRVVMPLYGQMDREDLEIRPLKKLPGLALRAGGRMRDVRYHVRGRAAGRLQVFCVECAELFDRPGIYNAPDGSPFPDAVERMALHGQAALLMPRLLDWPADIVHVHDAQTVPAALYRRLWYAGRGLPGPGATVLTIHNLAHQEIHPAAAAEALGLPAGQAVYLGLLEFHGRINLMKAGILVADRLNTVSPGYAQETVSGPEAGCGLHQVLAGRGEAYTGILNGADYRTWDPGRDPLLPAAYDRGDLTGKVRCRDALLAELGLEAETDRNGRLRRPLCGFVGRLVTQKGVDLMLPILARLAGDGFRFAILGTGEKRLEDAVRTLAADQRGRIAFCDRYDEGLAHRIYAGSDVFLMPSLFEPCGLSQMYALRYGAPPVVRRTGGLADTVVGPPDPAATGFVFSEPRSEDLLACLRAVEKIWADQEAWARLQERGMALRFDWDASAAAYEDLYAEALAEREGGRP